MRKIRIKTLSLYRRNNSVYFRAKLPIELSTRIGISEIKKSLGDISLSRAGAYAARYRDGLNRVFAMAIENVLGNAEVKSLVQVLFNKISKEVDFGYTPASSNGELEAIEQKSIAEEMVLSWTAELDDSETSEFFIAAGNDFLSENGLSIEDINPALRQTFYEGVIRAYIEQQRKYIYKIENKFTDHKILDNLFIGHETAQLPPSASLKIVSPTKSKNSSPKSQMLVSEVFEKFSSSNIGSVEPKELDERKGRFAKFLIVLGGDKVISEINKEDIINYRDALLNFKYGVAFKEYLTLTDLIANKNEKKLSSATAIKYLGTIQLFFKWACAENYLTTNPSEISGIKNNSNGEASKPRRAFSKTELETLFGSPYFTGCKGISPKQRALAGPHIIKDDRYWVPIICYYTGARVGEIIQMHFEDLILNSETPYIKICGNQIKSGPNKKSLKTKTSNRIVPLHPDLFKLGFQEFVTKELKRKPKDQSRLFWRVKFSSNYERASDVFSKRFAGMLDNLGLVAPDLTLHSLRHTLYQALTNSKIEKIFGDRILGHSTGGMSLHYDNNLWPQTAYEAILKVKFQINLPEFFKELEAKKKEQGT